MAFQVISFYRYETITEPHALRDQLRTYCKERDIVGRILIAHEGINGAVSGLASDIDSLKTLLAHAFTGITFRERAHHCHAYHKLVVRVRSEICAFNAPVDLSNTGNYVEPHELKHMYDNNDDFVILDARNTYEAEVGAFKNATVLPIHTFKQFPDAAAKLSIPKNKKIIMYCTGGIRCEKASAFMKAQGYENVHHLKGGIINYLNQYPGQHYDGGCFVFDDRLLDQTEQPITHCAHCNTPSSLLVNCHNLECDALYITCEPCKDTTRTTCSAACTNAPRQRTQKNHYPMIGRVEHYYPNAQVALIRLKKPVENGWHILINGHTTKNVKTTLQHMRNHDGKSVETVPSGSVITIRVPARVRKNDAVKVLSA